MRTLSFFVLTIAFVSTTHAEPLRWAADTESGAPYVFQDPRNPNRLMGFEYDVITAIAKKLGREPQFVQNTWEGLVLGLKRNQYDVIINGIEITEDRKREILFSDPYFVTFEQLTIRKDDTTIEQLSDLVGKKVGTLRGSLAERILQQEGIEAAGYEAETNAYEDLKIGRTDAVLLDEPIAQYYANADPALKMVGSPVGQILYGIGIRKTDHKLQQDINHALKEMVHSGELHEIYDRWNLWTPTMASFFNDPSPSRTPPSSYEYFLKNSGKHVGFSSKLALYWSFLPILTKGAWMTLKISLSSMILAVTLGLMLALMRIYAVKPISWLSIAYIEIIRGTPLLIQLFFIFYALPHIGIKFSPFVAAVLGLGLNYAACEAENYRAGIQGIPKSQMEAATALGFTRRHSLRYVILPQAMRIVLPPVTNDFIALLKDSSLVSVITMVELTKLYGQLASTYYDFLGTGILVAAFYLLLGLPFVRLSMWVEKKYGYKH